MFMCRQIPQVSHTTYLNQKQNNGFGENCFDEKNKSLILK